VPRLRQDISRPNSVASTEGGQICAASVAIGIQPSQPQKYVMVRSPKMKNSSGPFSSRHTLVYLVVCACQGRSKSSRNVICTYQSKPSVCSSEEGQIDEAGQEEHNVAGEDQLADRGLSSTIARTELSHS
jgi:hypothetical protein